MIRSRMSNSHSHFLPSKLLLVPVPGRHCRFSSMAKIAAGCSLDIGTVTPSVYDSALRLPKPSYTAI